jgi:hypothetical protein
MVVGSSGRKVVETVCGMSATLRPTDSFGSNRPTLTAVVATRKSRRETGDHAIELRSCAEIVGASGGMFRNGPIEQETFG